MNNFGSPIGLTQDIFEMESSSTSENNQTIIDNELKLDYVQATPINNPIENRPNRTYGAKTGEGVCSLQGHKVSILQTSNNAADTLGIISASNIFMHSFLNGEIKITGDYKIEANSVDMDVSTDMDVNAGSDYKLTTGNDLMVTCGNKIDVTAGTDYKLATVQNMEMVSGNEFTVHSSGDVAIDGLTGHSFNVKGGNVLVRGEDDMKVYGVVDVSMEAKNNLLLKGDEEIKMEGKTMVIDSETTINTTSTGDMDFTSANDVVSLKGRIVQAKCTDRINLLEGDNLANDFGIFLRGTNEYNPKVPLVGVYTMGGAIPLLPLRLFRFLNYPNAITGNVNGMKIQFYDRDVGSTGELKSPNDPLQYIMENDTTALHSGSRELPIELWSDYGRTITVTFTGSFNMAELTGESKADLYVDIHLINSDSSPKRWLSSGVFQEEIKKEGGDNSGAINCKWELIVGPQYVESGTTYVTVFSTSFINITSGKEQLADNDVYDTDLKQKHYGGCSGMNQWRIIQTHSMTKLPIDTGWKISPMIWFGSRGFAANYNAWPELHINRLTVDLDCRVEPP